MTTETSGQTELEQRAKSGDTAALAELFERSRERLRKMIDLRMDERVSQRVDPSDVLQEAYVDLADQLANYVKDPKLPFFIWMRRITGLRLAKVHREHLDVAKRDIGREVSLHRGPLPQVTSFALASRLVGNVTAPEDRAIRAERQLKLEEVINTMAEDDREIIALRHFEQMTTQEVAAALEITEAAAGMRYLRAVRRLQKEVKDVQGLFGNMPDGIGENG